MKFINKVDGVFTFDFHLFVKFQIMIYRVFLFGLSFISNFLIYL